MTPHPPKGGLFGAVASRASWQRHLRNDHSVAWAPGITQTPHERSSDELSDGDGGLEPTINHRIWSKFLRKG